MSMFGRLEVQQRKNSVSKELEDYKLDNHKFMQEMNNKITTGKTEHIDLSNEVGARETKRKEEERKKDVCVACVHVCMCLSGHACSVCAHIQILV